MVEKQNIEWKESWRDEYLRWICGFANAQGGKLYIGINDSGRVVGIQNSKKLLEDIPNKIQQSMGIIADVNLLSKNGLEYIEVSISPSMYPVSYHGEFHYRSGSTKQLLTGIALTEFINRKTGFHWEDVPVNGITLDDLDAESIAIFKREAKQRNRMSSDDLKISNEELLNKLGLMVDGKLTRAAVLLFTDKAEKIQVGNYAKVGKFGKGSDLQYQDLFESSLISTADKIIDVIYLKYLKAHITYEHDRRVETYPYARDAIREAVYNALVHNCYMFGIPIQIRINEDEIIISNSCSLPEDWTVETLLETHNSAPYNPHISKVFYLAGYIENWGRGIQKIFETCHSLDIPEPSYSVLGNTITVKFPALQNASITITNDGNHDGNLTEIEALVYKALQENPRLSAVKMAETLQVSRPTIERAEKSLKGKGYIARQGKTRGIWIILKK